MKNTIIILPYLLLLTSCFGQTKTDITENRQLINDEIDTIIERNNPNSLDFSTHQLFIDTTRTYIYYERIENSDPLQNPQQTTIDYINEMFKDQNFEKFDFKEFPRLWLTLRKYKGEFILYDRCDGSDPAYRLTDSTFNIYGVHEFDIRMITDLIKINDSEIEIKVVIDKKDSQEKPLRLTIEKTEYKDVYILTYEGYYVGTTYVTPIENVRNFDLLVNHCPINKVVEFENRFDN